MRNRRRNKLLVWLVPIGVTLLFLTTTYARPNITSCVKNYDCDVAHNEECVMYDFYNQPAVWPRCPKIGYCDCIDGTSRVKNGSCLPDISLNLYDKCTNEANERFLDMYACIQNGTQFYIGCNNSTYIDVGGYCELAPVTTTQLYPFYSHQPLFQNRTIVGFLDNCTIPSSFSFSLELICNATQGLACQSLDRIGNSNHGQCYCQDDKKAYDFNQQLCRPRLYGDSCWSTSDCDTGLMGLYNSFECRLGRCRCRPGFEPYDIYLWDYDTKTPTRQRTCIISGAVTWVPTGHTCTMTPQKWSSSKTTRFCHSRAFCHLCYYDYVAKGNLTSLSEPVMGTCRELGCSDDGGCLGTQAMCNRWDQQFDPPCDVGVCDCVPTSGYYKDRFSRCSPYRMLKLGDRCLPHYPHGLHPWYQTNENWDIRYDCQLANSTKHFFSGFAASSWGTLKCAWPYQEDVDGACVTNDRPRHDEINFNQTCNETDIWRRWTCNSTELLKCNTNTSRCECDKEAVIASQTVPHWVGCPNVVVFYGNSSSSSSSSKSSTTTVTYSTSKPNSVLWDALMARCRLRTLGDSCEVDYDCDGGICGDDSTCQCAPGLTAVPVTRVTKLDNSYWEAELDTFPFCFASVKVVEQGDECHLDPITWACSPNMTYYRFHYGYQRVNYTPPLVCRSPLVCIRCPGDYRPEDDNRGICRAFTKLADPEPVTTVTITANEWTEGNCNDYDEDGWQTLWPTPAPNITQRNNAPSQPQLLLSSSLHHLIILLLLLFTPLLLT